jgi:hypothetical protein
LTAASCLELADKVEILVGRKMGNSQQSFKLFRKDNSFIKHPDFKHDKHNIHDDIALIMLPRNIKFDENVQPVDLTTDDDVALNNEKVLLSNLGPKNSGCSIEQYFIRDSKTFFFQKPSLSYIINDA